MTFPLARNLKRDPQSCVQEHCWRQEPLINLTASVVGVCD